MEKTISNAIIKAIKQQPGCTARKRYSNGSSGTTGWPDITGSIHGIRLEIETKQPGKKPSKLQLNRIKRFRAKNMISFWTDDKMHALEEIERQYDECIYNLPLKV